MTVNEILDAIKELKLLEVAELVKAMEEEFGVSAAAPVMVAAGGDAGADGHAERDRGNHRLVHGCCGEQQQCHFRRQPGRAGEVPRQRHLEGSGGCTRCAVQQQSVGTRPHRVQGHRDQK